MHSSPHFHAAKLQLQQNNIEIIIEVANLYAEAVYGSARQDNFAWNTTCTYGS